MIQFLLNKDIDKSQWDRCIAEAGNSFIYGYSWYLDIVAPGWNGLVFNDYKSVMPIPTVRKIFTMAYQPFFTQQLGAFNLDKSLPINIGDFLDALPSNYKYINVCLNEANDTGIQRDYKIKPRINFILYLHKPYETLFKEYSEHNRRNVNKAFKFDLQIADCNSDEVVDFYIHNKGEETVKVGPRDYERLKKLLHKADELGFLLSKKVTDPDGAVLACGAFYLHKNRLIYQIGSSNQEGRNLRAMFYLFDRMIHHFSNQDIILDFEGSDIESVARFFSGFGALRMPYHRLIFNRLPWPFSWLKK